MCVGIMCCIIGQAVAADDYYPVKMFTPCDDTCHKIDLSFQLGFTVPDSQARVTCILSWLPSGITRQAYLPADIACCHVHHLHTCNDATVSRCNDEVKHVWATSMSALVRQVTMSLLHSPASDIVIFCTYEDP